jgi:cob(I)alamin adenosyltransferase
MFLVTGYVIDPVIGFDQGRGNMRGYVHVYTGEGKGKTTAALGLAIRAAGAGHKVFLGQFVKGGFYSELNALKRFDDLITVEQFGLGRFIKGKPSESDINAARNGLNKMRDILSSGEYKVVILDEANIALHYNLFSLDELIELIDCKADKTELIITGRNASPEILKRADLITEMKEIKHYYKEGVVARVGIEK